MTKPIPRPGDDAADPEGTDRVAGFEPEAGEAACWAHADSYAMAWPWPWDLR